MQTFSKETALIVYDLYADVIWDLKIYMFLR